MAFTLRFAAKAHKVLTALERNDSALYFKVTKTLAQLQFDPMHPGLRSHQFRGIKGPQGQNVWESYVTQSGAAWRIWWCYGADETNANGSVLHIIEVITIGKHSK